MNLYFYLMLTLASNDLLTNKQFIKPLSNNMVDFINNNNFSWKVNKLAFKKANTKLNKPTKLNLG